MLRVFNPTKHTIAQQALNSSFVCFPRKLNFVETGSSMHKEIRLCDEDFSAFAPYIPLCYILQVQNVMQVDVGLMI